MIMASASEPKDMSPNPQVQEPHYTVFIRLPFPRGDFVDPAPVLTLI